MIEISTDKSRLKVEVIHQFLTESYWAKGRTLEEVKTSLENCLCFGVYIKDKQIGFARVLTDYVVFGYLMDVFILPDFRGNGYSKLLIKTINESPDLKNCKMLMLKTADAHNLYCQFGYTELKKPEKLMERIIK